MKILITFFFFALTYNVYSYNLDTTIKADLNFDKNEETIRLKFNEQDMSFSIKINNAEVKGIFEYSYDAGIQIIDMNRNDGLKEVIIKGYGNSDQTDMYFYQFIDGNVVECGHLPSNFGVDTKGDNILTEYGWMGFWDVKIKYEFDTKNKTLTRIEEEFYEVNKECEVKNPFKLLVKRDDNSETAVTLKPKTKLTIVKADISQLCKSTDGYDDNFFCDWYFIKTEDGKQGWVRLRDFYENVDGLIWAG